MRRVNRWLPIAFLSAAILTLVGLGVWALWATTLLTAMPCGDEPSVVRHFENGHPGDLRWKMATSGAFAVSFLGGHLLGYVRESRPLLLTGPPRGRPAFWLQFLLPVFLTVVAALLLYEAWALADPARWPITSYVRCATIVAPVPSVAAACAVCALLGHWFWPPRERTT